MCARVRDVVRDVVAEVAPDEVLLLDRLARLDEGSVTRLFERRVQDMDTDPHLEPDRGPHADRHTDPLECGHVDVTAPVTPIVWLALDEAARRTTCRTDKRRTPLLHHLLRRRPQPPPAIHPLTAAQLDAVRHLVRDHVRSARLGEDAATALADAVASRLALELTDAG
ncbi:hypothetical protein [Streptomyces sp. NPDC002790]|uniref:hypothetical protein n=1 Tax=Streptomyces sp. NPDC002790 TaxID=3154431 RepID=UPI00332BF212